MLNIKFKNIAAVVVVSSIIGFAYNHLSPNGLPLIKQERVLQFEDDSSSVINNENGTEKASETDSLTDEHYTGAVVNSNSDENKIPPFGEPIAIKLNRAYELYNKGVQFIDSRSKEEFETGHIKNAVNIPFYESEKYEDVLSKISKDEIVITYCSGEDCDLSIMHGDELFEKGYKRVYIFYGGWNDWLNSGYPIESSN